eukprot:647912-Hanusia_phi.AAC.2
MHDNHFLPNIDHKGGYLAVDSQHGLTHPRALEDPGVCNTANQIHHHQAKQQHLTLEVRDQPLVVGAAARPCHAC